MLNARLGKQLLEREQAPRAQNALLVSGISIVARRREQLAARVDQPEVHRPAVDPDGFHARNGIALGETADEIGVDSLHVRAQV